MFDVPGGMAEWRAEGLPVETAADQHGFVEVDEMMVLESYTHVHHIVSNVRGRLRADVTPGEAIRAVFPGGTITGCPKVRCMQIIAELEVAARGAYTGSFGYLNRDGSMDLNILIRTMVRDGDAMALFLELTLLTLPHLIMILLLLLLALLIIAIWTNKLLQNMPLIKSAWLVIQAKKLQH